MVHAPDCDRRPDFLLHGTYLAWFQGRSSTRNRVRVKFAAPSAVPPAWRLVRWLLLLAFLPASTALLAGVPLTVDRLEADVPLADAAAVLAGDYDARWAVQPQAWIVPSPRHGTWYRISLRQPWSSTYSPMLRIFDPPGLHVRAWLPPDYVAQTASVYEPLADRGFTRESLVFRLPLDLGAGVPLYVHLAPERAIPRAIDVELVTVARAEDLVKARLEIFFPAIQLATVLVMLAFFFVLRERMYAYFVGHVVFLVLHELYSFGVGYDLPVLKWLTPLEVGPVWLMAALAAWLLCEFTRGYLKLPRTARGLDRILRLARWPLLGGAVMAMLPGLPTGWLSLALGSVFGVLVPLLILAGVQRWRRGDRSGAFYVCAWTPALSLVLVRVAQIQLDLPLPGWLVFSLPAAFAFSSVVLAFGLADYTLSVRKERDTATRLAARDPLTGTFNRRAILESLDNAFRHAREGRRPLSLLFLDLDHFKDINDRLGHAAGDTCLRALVDPIHSELREGDALGRYGGEEFLVVLPGATAANARLIAERIRTRVEAMRLVTAGEHVCFTLSIGVAGLDASVATADDLIERADRALYAAKAAGRNCVRTNQAGQHASVAAPMPSGTPD